MAKLIIDGKTYEVEAGKNVLETCLSLGLDMPYFCWHPALGSVGACRQCAIIKYKDENDDKGKLTMACMEPVQDNLRISIKAVEAEEFRGHVIEWLMTNHPHDCPICDEGGECHLQDMTVMTGHNYREFRYNKRTYKNQYLGPFINHEMNRCIQCYRCVRFYRDYADGRDLDAFASRNYVYFGRSEDGVLENEFSGNLVEVCPTGVFTDKTLKKHYTRKWDLTAAPSICSGCSLGCNTIAGERYGGLRRILSRYNSEVNGYFLCDRGRFGYEYVNDEKRIKQPMVKGKGRFEFTDKESALERIGKLFKQNKNVIGIGSPRASLESNFALRKLVGEENFFSGMSETEDLLVRRIIEILTGGEVKTPSLKEIENSDAVLILGEDLTNTAPMMALAVRQSVKKTAAQKASQFNIPGWQAAAVQELLQDEKGPLFNITPYETKLADAGKINAVLPPDDIALLGFAVANLIDGNSPAVKNLPHELSDYAEEIAHILKNSKKPVIISGASNFSMHIINSAANIAKALKRTGKEAGLSFVLPESNSMGLGLMNAADLNKAVALAGNKKIDAAVILENNIYRRLDKTAADNFFEDVKEILALDFIENETTGKVDLIIPAGTFAESDGTLVNNEGRAQRYYQVYMPDGDVTESWRWLGSMMIAAGNKDVAGWAGFDDYMDAMVKEFPVFKKITDITPPPDFRTAGQKIPRQPHRFSGRTAMNANKNVSEPKPPDDPDSPLTFTMEGYRGEPPSSIIPFFWSPGWNSVQSINKFQVEVGGPLHGGDPGKRIIQPSAEDKSDYIADMPEVFKPSDDEWLTVPGYYIFGSEELSGLSGALKERIPEPVVGLSPDDANKLGIQKDDKVEFTVMDEKVKFKAKVFMNLPEGVMIFPYGMSGFPFASVSRRIKLNGVKE